MKPIIKWVRGFLEANAPQSMTRAVALMCGIVGCIVALAGVWLSHRQGITPNDVAMAHELYLGCAMLIGGGAVSLLVRSKSPTDPPDIT